MLRAIKQFWSFISLLGINHQDESSPNDQMHRIFFNKCLSIGTLGLISQIYYCYIFVGNYGYLNAVAAVAAILSLYIHSKGHYHIAKRVAVYSMFITGLIISSLVGGSFLYHTGAITVLTFSWILFDTKKERYELIIFLIFTFSIYFIGEFNLFNAPDFSQHHATKVARIIGLIIYTSLISVFIFFIRRLNVEYSNKLSKTLIEKEILLNEILVKSEVLERERNELELVILERTDQLRQKKEVLEQQNQEKEILLKEIHHRVKNNLQIIVSLLNLQASKIDDKELLLSIRETQNRIVSMSLVHQRIYQNSNFDAINFKDYIDLLIENNKTLFPEKTYIVEYTNTTDLKLKMDIDRAIPLGLIINEMLTNSFKHAFANKGSVYNVSIELTRFNDQRFVLEYSDNGKGLPENFKLENSSTLGIQLIDALASQIDGKLSFYNDQGAVFKVVFGSDS